MKYLYAFCLFVLSFQMTAQDGLVAHFPFETCSLEEKTGVNPTAFPQGFEDPVCACGVRDSSLVFDGVDDRLLMVGNYDNYFDTDDFTISLNFKATNTLGNKVIFSKRDSCNDQRGIYLKYAAATNTITAYVGENSSKKVLVFGQLDAGRCWHHIALVRKLNKVSLYSNGKLLDDQSTVSTINCKNDAILQLGFGPCVGTTDFTFAGHIDDFRVYKKALKSEEIEDINFKVDEIGNKKDTIIINGSSVDIFTRLNTTCAIGFEWRPDDSSFGVADVNDPNTTITPPETNTYELFFRHPEGCDAMDSIRITVVDPDDLDCSEIFLPKAFTPNGDGLNDTYGISNPFAIVNFDSFEILDRWGGRVFYSEDPFGQWDGNHNGQKVNPGVCVYRIRYTCQGEEKILLGSLTVLR